MKSSSSVAGDKDPDASNVLTVNLRTGNSLNGNCALVLQKKGSRLARTETAVQCSEYLLSRKLFYAMSKLVKEIQGWITTLMFPEKRKKQKCNHGQTDSVNRNFKQRLKEVFNYPELRMNLKADLVTSAKLSRRDFQKTLRTSTRLSLILQIFPNFSNLKDSMITTDVSNKKSSWGLLTRD